MACLKWIAAGLAMGAVLCLLLLPAIQKTSEDWAWQRSRYSLRQIAEALHSYHSVYGQLPPAVIRGKDGAPLYNWRVALLPFLEQDVLYRSLRVDEPWDSAHNRPLLQETPRCYRPAREDAQPPGTTRFQVLVGSGTAFEPGATWEDFAEGKPNRILVVEAAEPVMWAAPADLTYDPAGPIPPLGRGLVKLVRFLGYQVQTRTGFNACFSDGRSRFMDGRIPEATLRALITGAGDETIKPWALE
jgi:uncharacterized protein DUF1559